MIQTGRLRRFLVKGDAAYAVIHKWQAVGVCCVLSKDGLGFEVNDYTWPEPGHYDNYPSPATKEAMNEITPHYNAILLHLQYWRDVREKWERIMAMHASGNSKKEFTQ